jgi:hypothetical protein
VRLNKLEIGLAHTGGIVPPRHQRYLVTLKLVLATTGPLTTVWCRPRVRRFFLGVGLRGGAGFDTMVRGGRHTPRPLYGFIVIGK